MSPAALIDAALASAPDGFVVFDGDGACVYENAAAARMLGRSREELGARPFGDWPLTTLDGLGVSPDELPTARALSDEGPHGAEGHYAVTSEDGRRAALSVRARPIRGADGACEGVVVTLRHLEEDEPGVRALVERHPELVAVVRKGVVVHANPAGLALAGFSRLDEVVGRPIEQFIPPEDRSPILERVRRAEEQGLPAPPRQERLLGRSTATPVLEVVSVPCSFDGQPSVLVFGRDVTARERNEARRERRIWELDLERGVLDAIIANAPIGVMLVRGPELVIEIANPTMQGFAPGIPMLGRTFTEVSPELPEVAALARRVFETGRPERVVDWPLQVQRREGGPLEPAWYTVLLVPMRGAEGAVEAVLGLAVETTEQVTLRRLIEETARAAQQHASRVRAVLDAIPDAVFVAAPDGDLVLGNHAAVRLAGGRVPATVAALGELLQVRRADGQRVPSADLPLSRALGGERVELDDAISWDEGSRTDRRMRVNALAIRGGRGELLGAVEVARDVTELTDLDRIQQQFVQVAAHELNTPLTALKGRLQVLERGPLSPAQAASVAAIGRSVERMIRLVEDLVYISELEIGGVALVEQTVDLAALVRTVSATYAPFAPRHRVEVDAPDSVAVRADRDGLRYVIASLVDNAIRFSPGGGPVAVRVEASPEEVAITVRDRGVGIPAAAQRHLFQKFYRGHAGTAHDYGGLGVSLYISRAIVERHGGRIHLESVEGRGTTARVVLPRRP